MNPRQSHFVRTPAAFARLTVLAVAALFAVPGIFAGTERGPDGRLVFRDLRLQTEQFIDYWSAIRLTPAQEHIKAEALDAIPAPCCKDYPMKTCCCPCNLAKSAWGFSHYLIAKRGYTVPEVKRAVTALPPASGRRVHLPEAHRHTRLRRSAGMRRGGYRGGTTKPWGVET